MFLQMLSHIKCAQPLLKLPDAAMSIKSNVMQRSISSLMNPAWRDITLRSPYNSQHTSNTAPLNNLVITRNAKYAYRPNAAKRIMKHGLEKRLSTRSQREVLFKRIIKGRKVICLFPRLINEHPALDKKEGKRVQLFSKDKGYATLHTKGSNYYKFRE